MAGLPQENVPNPEDTFEVLADCRKRLGAFVLGPFERLVVYGPCV